MFFALKLPYINKNIPVTTIFANDVQDFRILENGRIKISCLFSIVFEPKEWSYFLLNHKKTYEELCDEKYLVQKYFSLR
jgi:hypothetical protein